MKRQPIRVVLVIVATFVVGFVLANGNVEADQIDSGPEAGLVILDEELADLRDSGYLESSGEIQNISEQRDHLLDLARQPAPPEPTQEEIDSHLNHPEPALINYPTEEHACEGGSSLTKNVDFPEQVRCFSIAIQPGVRIETWLTSDGWAFAHIYRQTGILETDPAPTKFTIPVIADLLTADIELDGRSIGVVSDEVDVSILTDEWFPEIARIVAPTTDIEVTDTSIATP